MLLVILSSQGAGSDVIGALAQYIMLFLIIEIIVAAVGGVLGFLIVAESEKNPIEESVEE